MNPRPALLISGGHGLRPLWEGLAEQYDLVFTSAAVGAEAQAQKIVGASALADHLDGDLQEQARNTASILTARVVYAMPEIERRFRQWYVGLPIPELNGRLETWWPGFVSSLFHNESLLLLALARVCDNRPVVGVIVHEDVTPENRALVMAGRARGLPTIHLPHAPCHMTAMAGKDIHRETRAEWIAASGDYMADWYAAQGHPREKVRIVGAPQWDSYYHTSLPTKAVARRVLKIDNERVILYGTTWAQTTSLRSEFDSEIQATWQAVLDLAAKWQAVLLVNLHPSDPESNVPVYANAMAAANIPGLVTRHHERYLVRAADIVIKHSPSNFCVNAAIMSTPSCYVQTAGFDFAGPLPPRGPVEKLSEIAEQALALPPDAWDEFVRPYNSAHPDGDATERALKFVREICQSVPMAS